MGAALLVLPLMAAAQQRVPSRSTSPRPCTGVLECLPQYLNTALGLAGVLALAGIVWGIYNYLIAKGNQDRVEAGRHAVLASVLLLAVLVAVHAVLSPLFRTLNR